MLGFIILLISLNFCKKYILFKSRTSDELIVISVFILLQRAYELSSEITTSDWLNRCYYTTFTKYKNAEINAYGNDFEVSIFP